jgi:DNA-binding MarR family transcriptional regulator
MPSSAKPDAMAAVSTELDRGLARLQRLLSSRRIFASLATAAGVDLSQQAVQVLRVLDEREARPVADVARAARMDTGAVSRQLTTLEDRGYAQRSPSPDHGSVVLVTATARGAAVADRFAEVQGRHLAEALVGWSSDERAQLGRLLVRLVDDMQRTPYRTRTAGAGQVRARTR